MSSENVYHFCSYLNVLKLLSSKMLPFWSNKIWIVHELTTSQISNQDSPRDVVWCLSFSFVEIWDERCRFIYDHGIQWQGYMQNTEKENIWETFSRPRPVCYNCTVGTETALAVLLS